MLDCKIKLLGLAPQLCDYATGMHFLGVTTLAAHQEYCSVRLLRMRTGQVGIVRRQTMHQTLFEQKVQRTVNRWRRRRTTGLTQLVQQLVGAHGLFGLADQLQHLLAQPGKPQITLVTKLRRLIDQPRNLL
jgi:hypothetical protein